MIHPNIEKAFQEIAAAVFSSDCLEHVDFRQRLSDFLVRWQTAVNAQVVDMQASLDRYQADDYNRQQSA